VTNKARARAHAIASRLGDRFDLVKTQLVGSHTMETAVAGISDIDLFVVLRRSAVRWGDSIVSSDTLLKNVRQELQDRYPSSPVRRDRMAISVAMDEGRSVIDVVPAVFKGPHPTAGLCFEIPDGEGGWVTTAPDRHLSYFRAANGRSGQKLGRVIRLIKHWRFARSQPIPLDSFHCEIALAANDVCASPGSYSSALAKTFAFLLSRAGAGIRDPLGVAGLIPAVHSVAQREVLIGALAHAVYNAELALEAERDGQVTEAVYRWRQVFNEQFPR
jgi:hypothetical protein